MASLLSKAKKTTSKRISEIRPGTYDSIVTAVGTPTGYKDGEAFMITYNLKGGKTSSKYTKTEIYFNDDRNPRTRGFVEYLKKSDPTIENWADLVGMKEKLTLQYEVNGKKYLNIVEREFIGR